MPNTRSEDLSDIFTPEGINKLEMGQLLRFRKDGSIVDYRITFLSKKSGKVRAKKTKTYHESEIKVRDKE